MKIPRHSFSLLEVLLALSLIAFLAAILIPRYSQLQVQTNTQVAQQQMDTLQKAILAWCAAQNSISAASSTYGSATSPSAAAWYGSPTGTNAITNYLDPQFVTAANLQAIGNRASISYFTTQQMQNITGAAVGNGPPCAYGVIYWPVDAGANTPRESGQPVAVLFLPPATAQSVYIAGVQYTVPTL